MLAKTSAGPAPAAAECKARTNDQLGGKVGLVATPSRKPSQVVRAELVGSDRCLAAGYVTRGTTPVLAMCRKLVAAGINPAASLECYRGTTLAITVASIGQGAGLEINGHGTGFRALRKGGAASPIRKFREAVSMTSLLAAALKYAGEHLPVFPCVPAGKTPAVARGFHAATTNPETIKRYWRIADRNIGIPTGSVSGFWVLDIDGDDGETTLRGLEARHGSLPRTREVITSSGGRHLWFKYAGPLPSTTRRIGAGLDTKGDGGYVIAPPSVHPSGRRYAWSSAGELLVAPEWLVRLARANPQSISERALAGIRRSGDFTRHPDAYGSAALEREIDALAATAVGGRNHALNRTSFRLFQLVGGGELDRNLVIDRLIDASRRNGLVNDDGLRSVMGTINSGMRAGLQNPRARGAS